MGACIAAPHKVRVHKYEGYLMTPEQHQGIRHAARVVEDATTFRQSCRCDSPAIETPDGIGGLPSLAIEGL